MNMNTVLSIQSHVSFGHVGNSQPYFPYSALAMRYGRYTL